MFETVARVVLPRGNGPFPGGSISEHVLRGPVRKEITTVQRAGRDVPKRATPQTSICPSCIQCFAHSSPSPPTLLSYAAEHRDRGAQQHSTSPMLPAVPLCGLPCLVIMITADPTLLETAHSLVAFVCQLFFLRETNCA